MSVTLNPSSSLSFQRQDPPAACSPSPLTQLVKRTLSVTNHNSSPIVYKVKTTAPKTYCVRPNSGRVEPGETVEVQVLLQPMKEDPPAGAKCRDKFLVQSVVVTAEREGLGLPELWQTVEREDKARQAEGGASEIHEQKIRCAYLPAADSDAVSAIPEETASRLSSQGANPAADSSFSSAIAASPSSTSRSGEGGTTSTPPAYSVTQGSPTPASPPSTFSESSPNPVAAKAQDAAAAAGSTAASAAAAVGLPNLAKVIEDKTPAPVASSSSASAGAAAAAGCANGASGEVAQLRAELAAARSEISRLKQQLDQAETTASTLRSRGAGASGAGEKAAAGGASQAVVEMKGSEGVPVQVVVGVAFGVFVVTWLFF
ncbi:hypothetical protein JCM6882_008671 [Rhodosporidiobolus microsporus]